MGLVENCVMKGEKVKEIAFPNIKNYWIHICNFQLFTWEVVAYKQWRQQNLFAKSIAL